MIAYRFQNLADHPHHGVLVQDNQPRPAVFIPAEKAKEETVFVPPGRMTIARIQVAVAEHYKFTPEHMRLPTRDRKFAYPRQLAMLLSREMTTSSLTEIGRRFGGRDHSTIFHGIKAARGRINKDAVTRAAYEILRDSLAE